MKLKLKLFKSAKCHCEKEVAEKLIPNTKCIADNVWGCTTSFGKDKSFKIKNEKQCKKIGLNSHPSSNCKPFNKMK